MLLKYSIFVITGLLIFGVSACNDLSNKPEIGDEVVIYNAKYNTADFEKVKKVHPEGFGKAMDASGQDRITYFLEDKENNQIVAISFFIKESTVEDWHNHEGRNEIIKILKPLLREPITHKKFTVINVHSTNK
ncbi:MAG: hypothetical protein ACR2NW_04710 [Thermodesulfobacteriota bacterium]